MYEHLVKRKILMPEVMAVQEGPVAAPSTRCFKTEVRDQFKFLLVFAFDELPPGAPIIKIGAPG